MIVIIPRIPHFVRHDMIRVEMLVGKGVNGSTFQRLNVKRYFENFLQNALEKSRALQALQSNGHGGKRAEGFPGLELQG